MVRRTINGTEQQFKNWKTTYSLLLCFLTNFRSVVHPYLHAAFHVLPKVHFHLLNSSLLLYYIHVGFRAIKINEMGSCQRFQISFCNTALFASEKDVQEHSNTFFISADLINHLEAHIAALEKFSGNYHNSGDEKLFEAFTTFASFSQELLEAIKSLVLPHPSDLPFSGESIPMPYCWVYWALFSNSIWRAMDRSFLLFVMIVGINCILGNPLRGSNISLTCAKPDHRC